MEPHLWLAKKIPTRTWDNCHSTSERKRRTQTYDDLVDLLIELALERQNDSHMETFLKKHLGKGANSTPERGERKGPKHATNANKGGGKGGGNLRAMSEGKPEADLPPLFFCKPVNDKGGPCHAPDCDHRSGCVLQQKRQQHTKDGITVTHQDHFRCTIACGYCGKLRHYEDECHIKKRQSDKQQEAERQKAQTTTRTPRNAHTGGKVRGKRGGKGGTPNPQRRSSAPATSPSPDTADPKKRPQGDNASPAGSNSKKRRLAWTGLRVADGRTIHSLGGVDVSICLGDENVTQHCRVFDTDAFDNIIGTNFLRRNPQVKMLSLQRPYSLHCQFDSGLFSVPLELSGRKESGLRYTAKTNYHTEN